MYLLNLEFKRVPSFSVIKMFVLSMIVLKSDFTKHITDVILDIIVLIIIGPLLQIMNSDHRPYYDSDF